MRTTRANPRQVLNKNTFQRNAHCARYGLPRVRKLPTCREVPTTRLGRVKNRTKPFRTLFALHGRNFVIKPINDRHHENRITNYPKTNFHFPYSSVVNICKSSQMVAALPLPRVFVGSRRTLKNTCDWLGLLYWWWNINNTLS